MQLKELKNSQKGLIIHHWDADGLCSAAMFLNHFQEINPDIRLEYRPPVINNYFLTDLELTQIAKEEFDFILAVDIKFPKETIQALQKITPQFFWFDHHHQEEVVEAQGMQDSSYKSNAAMLTDYLELEDKSWAALALVGDQEEKVKDHEIVQQFDFEKLMQAKSLVDSNYIVNDYEGMKQTVRDLQENPLEINKDTRLIENLAKIKAEEEKAINKTPQELGQVYSFHLESPYNILSAATRKIAKKYPDKIIICTQSHIVSSNLYVRTKLEKIDLREYITYCKEKGYSCGGKKEVLGAMVPTEELDYLRSELINKLK